MTRTLPIDSVFAGDVGVEFILNTGIDLTLASNTSIVGMTGRNTPISWAAGVYTLEGKMQYLRYVSQANDLIEVGEYRIQVRFTIGIWTGRGKYFYFKVEA